MSSAVKYQRTLFEPEHDLFRESYRGFLERHVAPHHEEWEKAKIVGPRGVASRRVSRASWGWRCPRSTAAGATPTFATHTIIVEETVAGRYSGYSGSACTTDVWRPTLLNITSEEQKAALAARFLHRGTDHGDRDDRAGHR